MNRIAEGSNPRSAAAGVSTGAGEAEFVNQGGTDSDSQGGSQTLEDGQSRQTADTGEAPPKVLVVEDDLALLETLSEILRTGGYEPIGATGVDQALQAIRTETPDLVILDLRLPDGDGLDVCRGIRWLGKDTPIIILSGRTEEADVVVALEVGADDFIKKPVRVREFLARVRAHLRRGKHSAAATSSSSCRVADLEVDLQRQRVSRDGQPIKLTTRLFDVLRLLISNRGRVVTRQQIVQEVWNGEISAASRVVDHHILRLRRKIERDPATPEIILSDHGKGYRLVG